MKFAITETLLGAIITAFAGILGIWYLPAQYSLRLASADNMPRMVFFNPGSETFAAHYLVIGVIVLGLCVFACGIFRIIKARKEDIIHERVH
ncbi:MAG: hypothetical protein PHU23_17310 [Dehalococcoidales bacterium]|nr:hypothetical protein [Dehalococcoidales bacterium]